MARLTQEKCFACGSHVQVARSWRRIYGQWGCTKSEVITADGLIPRAMEPIEMCSDCRLRLRAGQPLPELTTDVALDEITEAALRMMQDEEDGDA